MHLKDGSAPEGGKWDVDVDVMGPKDSPDRISVSRASGTKLSSWKGLGPKGMSGCRPPTWRTRSPTNQRKVGEAIV